MAIFSDLQVHPISRLETCFLFDHLNAEVNKHRPKTLIELKAAIGQEITATAPEIFQRVMKNCINREQMCIAKTGRHLDHIILETN